MAHRLEDEVVVANSGGWIRVRHEDLAEEDGPTECKALLESEPSGSVTVLAGGARSTARCGHAEGLGGTTGSLVHAFSLPPNVHRSLAFACVCACAVVWLFCTGGLPSTGQAGAAPAQSGARAVAAGTFTSVQNAILHSELEQFVGTPGGNDSHGGHDGGGEVKGHAGQPHRPFASPRPQSTRRWTTPPPPEPALHAKLKTAQNTAKGLVAEGRQCYFRMGHTRSKAEQCFCHLAGNRGCTEPCTCRGGCGGTWQRTTTVSFPNIQKAQSCSQTTALLTVPRSHFEHLGILRSQCPEGTMPILVDLLLDGFYLYQEHVAKSAVRQCVHSPEHVTVPWLHVHTFCPDGRVDGMPLSPPQANRIAYCDTVWYPEDVLDLARRIIDWVEYLDNTRRSSFRH